jgi:hypothetical protein
MAASFAKGDQVIYELSRPGATSAGVFDRSQARAFDGVIGQERAIGIAPCDWHCGVPCDAYGHRGSPRHTGRRSGPADVRFDARFGLRSDIVSGPECAKSGGHHSHSMTLSARAMV